MNKEAIKIENNNYEPSVAQDVTPENKKKGNTKKIIAIVTSVIVVICLAIGIWFAVEKNANKWDLKQNEVTIEYGEFYEPTIADLVDVEKYPNVKNSNTSIKINDATYEIDTKNTTAPIKFSIGSYDIDVVHKSEYKFFGVTVFSMNDTKKVKLSVKDTIAPVFEEDVPTELETYKDCEIENIEETFKATDLSEVTITIDEIDYSTVGEYTVNVYATDESGNVATKEIKVKVLEPSISIEPTSLDMTVGNTANLTATVKGKDQTVEWTSSDESIAKVENGTVTAKKEGTTTVVAKANGTETSATVVVTNVTQKNSPSNQSTGTTQSQGNKNGNSSSNSTGSSGGSTSSASTTTTAPSAYYCDEGGSHHRRNVGQIGWYSTAEEAQQAVSQYIASLSNGGGNHFTITRCTCGLYTAYIN